MKGIKEMGAAIWPAGFSFAKSSGPSPSKKVRTTGRKREPVQVSERMLICVKCGLAVHDTVRKTALGHMHERCAKR